MTTLSSRFELFCDEIWITICSYLDSLKYFIRFKLCLGKKLNYILSENKHQFWSKLVINYLSIRKVNITQCINSIRGMQAVDLKDINYKSIAHLFSNKKCSHSGCFRIFNEWSNDSSSCLFHPGKKKTTGRLSCCGEKSFQTIGCKTSYHDGLFYSLVNLERPINNPSDGIDTIPDDEVKKSGFLPLIVCRPSERGTMDDKLIQITRPRVEYSATLRLPNLIAN